MKSRCRTSSNEMERSVLPERPIRAAELYDRAVYGSNVRRKPDETMADYCVRRSTDWDDLRKVSSDTSVSDDLRGYMLLRFSGLSRVEQTQVLASAGNSYSLKGIEASLRLQHPYAHKYHREKRSPSAYAVDQELESIDESYESFDDVESYEDANDDPYDDVSAHDTEYEDELGDQMPDIDESNDEDIEVFATMAQARHGRGSGRGRRGGRPRGRGRQSERGNSSINASAVLPPPSASLLPPVASKDRDDRAVRLRLLKEKSKCLDCGRYGH